jgi:hypothetical protein
LKQPAKQREKQLKSWQSRKRIKNLLEYSSVGLDSPDQSSGEFAVSRIKLKQFLQRFAIGLFSINVLK